MQILSISPQKFVPFDLTFCAMAPLQHSSIIQRGKNAYTDLVTIGASHWLKTGISIQYSTLYFPLTKERIVLLLTICYLRKYHAYPGAWETYPRKIKFGELCNFSLI